MDSGVVARVRAAVSARPALALVVFLLVVHVTRYLLVMPADAHANGDGHYIYLYARSLAYDGDLDFRNDYRICGDPFGLGRDHGTGHPANLFYIGPATIWTPFLVALRHLVPVPVGAPPAVAAGCHGRVVYALGLLGPVAIALTVALGMRIAGRFASPKATLVAGGFAGLSSMLTIFGVHWWPYAHVWGALALTLAVLAFLRAVESPGSRGRWFAVGAAIGWATLMRPHHQVWLLAPGLACLARMLPRDATLAGRGRAALDGLVVLMGFSLVFAVRLASYHYLYGSPWPPTLRTVFVQPAHAHPVFLLFSARAGLFTYRPLAWLAVFGFFSFLRRRPYTFGVPVAAALLLDVWVCASPIDWVGGATVGPRLLTSFAGLGLVFTALFLDRALAFLRARPGRAETVALVGTAAPLLALCLLLVDGAPRPAPEIYAGTVRRALESVHERIGNPAAFPVPLLFAARYDAPPKAFDQLAVYGLFRHDYDDGHLVDADVVDFARPPSELLLLEGHAPAPDGSHLVRGRPARALVTLSWPFVGGVELTVRGATPGCVLRGQVSSFTRTDALGHAVLGGDEAVVRLRARAGSFDSGINELRFSAGCDLTLVRMRFLDAPPAQRTILPRLRDGGGW